MTEADFREVFFSGRKCRKYAGKTSFLAFPRDLIFSFFWFFAQRCILGMSKTWPNPIFEKNFFPAENAGNMPEIAVFADFVWGFSSYFVIFSHKNIINNNTHHRACLNCHKSWFLMPELSKNRQRSQFSLEKRYFLNFSSCTLYFFMKFCTLMQNGNI